MRLAAPILVALGALVAATTTAAEEWSDSYLIERAWYSSDAIYVRYKITRSLVRSSLANIHGTVVKETRASYVLKFRRLDPDQQLTVALAGGEAAEMLIYQDGDVAITTSQGLQPVAARAQVRRERACDDGRWPRGALRYNDRVFYCGQLYDAAGHVISEVPAAVEDQLASGTEDISGTAPPVFPLPLQIVGAFADGAMIFAHRVPAAAVRSLRVADWRVSKASALTWAVVALPPSDAGYELLNDATAYSPIAIVARELNPATPSLLVCDHAGCERVGLAHLYSYVLIDGRRRQITTLTQRTVASPLTDVKVLAY